MGPSPSAIGGGGSAIAVARVLARLPLVASPVVSGHPGHQLLGVTALDVLEKLLGTPATQDRGTPPVVEDHDLAATLLELETLRSPRHAHERMPRRHRCRAGFPSPRLVG